MGKYSFANRVVDVWNDLPECVVSCESVCKFKEQVDVYLKNSLRSL